MTNSDITCEAFDAALCDWLEEEPGLSTRALMERHSRNCVRCAGIVRDIGRIREEAAALPVLTPSRDLWEGIEARIAATVLPLAPRPGRPKPRAHARMAAAAVLLVVSTASVTYMLTARSPSPSSGAAPGLRVSAPATGGAISSRVPDTGGPIAASATVARARVPVSVARREPPASPADAVYAKEIAMLQGIVGERENSLDPATVAIIKRNLGIIDAAIDQSRSALARDPASMLLSRQLTYTLDKKVELLRTAVMLPVGT